MTDIVIRVDNLGKQYRIGRRERYKTLRDTLCDSVSAPARWARSLVSTEATPTSHHASDVFWALKDLSFEVPQGSVVGVIGRNGAGKSTLLKVLSRITEPSNGTVEIHGRVGSLLEVGTGFHPELTGRENVFLNGAILGMGRAEITTKFDEIVAFAEIQRFIDTPVKHYSSGMYMRLAFAVAAHLEPDILVVDEVLAVGDAQFQKKCLGKMKEVGGQGRTVLFVSHNIGAILQLCTRCVYLENGLLKASTTAQEAVRMYSEAGSNEGTVDSQSFSGPLCPIVTFERVLVNDGFTSDTIVSPCTPITIKATGTARHTLPDFRTMLSIFKDGVRVLSLHDADRPLLLNEGAFEAEFVIPPNFLRPGTYSIAVGGRRERTQEWLWGTDLHFFDVLEQWEDKYEAANEGLVNLGLTGTRKQLIGASQAL